MRYGELEKALLFYTSADIHEKIPVEYYQRVIKTCIRANNNGLCWDALQAASILLYLAFSEGSLHPSQLNSEGLKSLDSAEKFLQQLNDESADGMLSASH